MISEMKYDSSDLDGRSSECILHVYTICHTRRVKVGVYDETTGGTPYYDVQKKRPVSVGLTGCYLLKEVAIFQDVEDSSQTSCKTSIGVRAEWAEGHCPHTYMR